MAITVYDNADTTTWAKLGYAGFKPFSNLSVAAIGALPVVQPVAPEPGSDVQPDEAIQFNVEDDLGFMNIYVFVRPSRTGHWLLAHDGARFMGGFALYSTRTEIANGYLYSVRYDTGWPAGGVDVRIDSYDREGQRGL